MYSVAVDYFKPIFKFYIELATLISYTRNLNRNLFCVFTCILKKDHMRCQIFMKIVWLLHLTLRLGFLPLM